MTAKKISIAMGFLILAGSANISQAQITNRYNLFLEDLYVLNPAAANTSDGFNISLDANLLNAGFDNAPKSMSLMTDGPVTRNTGFGFKIIHMDLGAFSTTQFLGSYAYKIKFGSDDHFLNMGLSLGMYWQNFNVGEIVAEDMEDEALTSDYYKKRKLANEAGVLYQWKNFRVGFAAPYLIQGYNQYYAHTAYRFTFPNTNGFEIEPNLLYQRLPEQVNQLDLSMRLRYNIVWVAYTYKTNNSMLASLGLRCKRYSIGYAYEFNNTAFSVISNCSHEIMLRVHFNLLPKAETSESEE